jgi:predicted DNA-binding WGR domain protein
MKNPIFEANPSLDCYFETSDGSCFFTENAAESHAQTLKNKKVKSVYAETTSTDAVTENVETTSKVAVVEPEKQTKK